MTQPISVTFACEGGSRPMRAAAVPKRPLLDFSDSGFIADPYPTYRLLRERAPVCRLATGGWVLTRYADIAAVLKSPAFGRDFEQKLVNPNRCPSVLKEPAYESFALSMVVRDPPDHTRIRGLLTRDFVSRRIEAMRSRVEAEVDELLDAIIPRGHMDVISDLARAVPAIIICDMLGIPNEDRPRFMSYRPSRRIFDPTPITFGELVEANAKAESIRAYLEDIFQRREPEPGNDLIGIMLQARDDACGRLSHGELVSNLAFLFNAGNETTTDLIGNGLLALHRQASQWEMLKTRPQLAACAVEELLRFDAPVQLTTRKAFEDVVLPGGTTIRRGEQVMCIIGAANRDPDVFADPDRLDITRSGARPLSFGGGIHYCLGAQLARIEAETVLRRVAERLPRLTLDDVVHPQWQASITLRGLKRLPARW